ncbi:MAG: NifB/NifX family molybdenum-iron cluster-binding protein [Chloroflexota bacterium]
MPIAISLEENNGLDSGVSTIFGRCSYYMFIDPKTMIFVIEENPARNASGGAGIQAAQFIVDKQCSALISGQLGPKAQSVLASAGIPVFACPGGTAREALAAFADNKLEVLIAPNASAHSGPSPRL